MKNQGLVKDYLHRAENRIAVLDVLYKRENWADVVRESQEAVELALKSLIRHANIEVPRNHDVSHILLENKALFAKSIQNKLEELADASQILRRDRELAFYGTEDLTPSQFYKKKHADQALKLATFVVTAVKNEID